MQRAYIFLLVFILAACSGLDGTALSFTPSDLSPSLTSIPQSPTLPPATRLPMTAVPDPTFTLQEPLEPPVSPTTGAPQVSSLPNPGAYTWRLLVGGLNTPLGLTHASDGTGRVFIVEQDGLIRIIKDGALLPTPFLDISDRALRKGSEQGLLGLAFHPRYPENGYFFVNYTDARGDTVIARYRVSDQDPDSADRGSETRILFISQPYGNHNGGVLAFGPDGYLYLGLGDGGSAGDPLGNGQSLVSLLGKILRLDIDSAEPYAIPPDNPFVETGGQPEIWAYGLRNPWRFSFDRLTGDLYIADVGQNLWEEIDFYPGGSPGGANFGWNYLEGNHPFRGVTPPGLELVFPVTEYGHDLGCSVTGGVVYRGERLPAWQGVYLYGDYCTGRVWGLLKGAEGNWQGGQLFEVSAQISSFGEDELGEVYLVDHGGSIYSLMAK